MNPRLRSNELITDALAMLKAAGFSPTIGGRKHIKIRWVNHGRTYTLIVSQSPSDHRAARRSRATLRRLLRANGRSA